MFFDTEDGETFVIDDLVLVDSIIPSGVKSYYNVYLSGGIHLSIREAYKTRASLILDWQSTRV